MMENKTKIDLKNKSVFITGVAGFIGSNLAKRLLSTVEGVKVVGLDNMNNYYDVRLKEARLKELEQFEKFSFVKGNLADKAVIESIFEQYKPEIVVNLGAQAGVRYSITNPDAYVEANLIGFEIFDKPGLFSNGRLRDEEVPEGLYRYDLRGSDYDPGQPVTVEKTVVVNHAASVLMAEELDLGAEGRLELGEEGLNFTGAELTVREFMEEQQQKRSGLIHGDSDHIAVEGHIGTWYAVDETEVGGEKFFLLEHEEHGDMTACVAVNEQGKLVAEDLWNGFDDEFLDVVKEYALRSLKAKKQEQPAQEQDKPKKAKKKGMKKIEKFLREQKPELLHHQKFLENGTAERAKESGTEQNYNMIDGCVNNNPKKPRIIGNRISVLDRLHIKLEERKQKSQPQQQQQQERSRKS